MKLKYRNRTRLVAALALPILALLALNGCSERNMTELELAKAPANGVVFSDAFLDGLDYAAFESSFYEALTIDNSDTYLGTHSLKITIPGGNWAGGSFYSRGPRDLSSFNALTFWAKASENIDLNSAGFGIGIIAPADYQGEIANMPLTTTWRRIIIPVPNPDVLSNERGLFWYSQAGGNTPVAVWFDEVQFANVGGITNARPVMATAAVEALLGEAVPITDTKTTFSVNGEELEVIHASSHFTYFSSDESVAVEEDGVVTAVGGGTATITASLQGTDVEGEITVTVIAPPATPAPTPTHPASDVISLFSDAYTNITVDTWRTPWSSSSTAVYDQQIDGDNVKAYVGLTSNAYVGIEFLNDQIDAATPGMTHFHLDVFAPTGAMIITKLVDFGPDGGFGGGDDTEKGLTFHGGTNPPFVAGEWVSLDIPLADFTGMNFGALSQLILQSINVGNVWIDNIYFHK